MEQNSKTKNIRIILTLFTLSAIIVTCLITITPHFSTLYNRITSASPSEAQPGSYHFVQPQINDAILCYQVSNNKPNFVAPKTEKAFVLTKNKDKYNRNTGIECVLDQNFIKQTDIPDISSSKQDYEKINILPNELGGEKSTDNQTQISAYAYNAAYVKYLRQIQDYLLHSKNKIAFEIALQYEDNTSTVPQGYKLSAYSCDDNGKTLMFNVYITNLTKKDL